MFFKKIANFREYLTILIAFAMFLFSPYAIRMLDPNAGAYDAGVLQIPVLAVMNFFIYNFTAWFAVNLIWPDARQFFNSGFSHAFNEITSWQKLKLCVGLFCFFLFVLVLLHKPQIVAM